MNFQESKLKGAYIFSTEFFEDNRGKFGRIFSADIFEKTTGLKNNIVQINHSFTTEKGTFRGFHYQKPPFTENKIIKCIKGAIFDIFIDVRKNSSTFLKFDIVELSDKNSKTLFLPEGFAHGFQTITDNVEMLYFHSQFYTPKYEAGINFSDSLIGLKLPLKLTNISEKDKKIFFLTDDFKGIEI